MIFHHCTNCKHQANLSKDAPCLDCFDEDGQPMNWETEDDKMTLTDEQRKSFEDVVRPVIEWLNKNCHPHTHIVIDNTVAELSEGVSVFWTEEYLKD